MWRSHVEAHVGPVGASKSFAQGHLHFWQLGLTSNPRFSSSSCTAQFASRSNPLMLKEPNLIWVGGGAGGFVFWRDLAWRRFLWCQMDFCLCLEGQKVSLSINLLFGFCVWLCHAWSSLMVWALLCASLGTVSAAGLSFCREIGDPVCYG